MRRVWMSWLLAGAVAVPQGAVVLGPGGSIVTTIARRVGYYSTPFPLTGLVVCSRGRVEEVNPPEDRRFWFNGEAGDPRLAGWRCAQLH
jgi:hypothetical protein